MTDFSTEEPAQCIKVPRSLSTMSVRDIRMYVAYLDCKLFNSHGVVPKAIKRKSDKKYYKYWLDKLIARGWAVRCKDGGTQLKCYQHVWRALGIAPSWCEKIKRFRLVFTKISIEKFSLKRSEYVKQIREMIMARIANNKIRQIKWRLANRRTNSNYKDPSISCRTVGKLFGLKSPASGSKFRKLLFPIIQEPNILLKMVQTYVDFSTGEEKTRTVFRNQCKRLAL